MTGKGNQFAICRSEYMSIGPIRPCRYCITMRFISAARVQWKIVRIGFRPICWAGSSLSALHWKQFRDQSNFSFSGLRLLCVTPSDEREFNWCMPPASFERMSAIKQLRCCNVLLRSCHNKKHPAPEMVWIWIWMGEVRPEFVNALMC